MANKISRIGDSTLTILEVSGKHQVLKIQNETVSHIITTRDEKEAVRQFESAETVLKELQ